MNETGGFIPAEAESTELRTDEVRHGPRSVASSWSPGDCVGPYEVIRRIARGGRNDAYLTRRATPQCGEQLFVLRVLRGPAKADDSIRESLCEAVDLVSTSFHPNVVRVFDAGTFGERPYVATEYVDGRNLLSLMKRCRAGESPIPLPLALYVAREVLSGLAWLHERQGTSVRPALRGDLSPARVLLTWEGGVKLDLDLLATAAAQVGKRGVAAVEWADDLAALGMLMSELLEQPPATAELGTQRLWRRRRPPPREAGSAPASVPVEVQELVRRAANARFGDAVEMGMALDACAPAWPGQRLALGALLRHQFFDSLERSSLRRRAAAAPRLSVAMYLPAPRASASLSSLLLASGCWIECAESVASLGDTVRYAPAPDAVMVDLDAPGLSESELLTALCAAEAPVPLIGRCESLTPAAAGLGHALGAVDLIPAAVQQVRLKASFALATAGSAGRPSQQPLEAVSPRRVVLVSGDAEYARRLGAALARWGFAVEAAISEEAALSCIEVSTFQCVLYDAPAGRDACCAFVAKLRGHPGIGLLPILFLLDKNAPWIDMPLSRVGTRRRDDHPLALASNLRMLISHAHPGRSYWRARATVPAEVVHDGRRIAAQTVDISRGGICVRARRAPLEGHGVQISFVLAETTVIEAAGVVRSLREKNDKGVCEVAFGIEFTQLSSEHERTLIAFLRQAATAAGAENAKRNSPGRAT